MRSSAANMHHREIRILTGPHRSQRAAAIDSLLHDNLSQALLIVPTRRYARARTVALLERFELPGLLGRPVLSFEDFVTALVAGTRYEQRRIGPIEQRVCLELAIAQVAANNDLETLKASAQTEGFLRHIQRVIGQLKQGAIEPGDFEQRVAARSNARPVDRAVSRIYAAYQTILKERGVYDLQGLYWMAHLCCAETSPPALANVDLLLVDDFDDFTPSEFRVLVSLRDHAALTFGLRLDQKPDRADLYALPLRTLSRLQAAFDVTAEPIETEPPESQTEYVTEHLFWRDKPPAFNGIENVRLIACHDQRHELETAAREVKHILRERPDSLDKLAIVAPDMAAIAEPLTAILGEYGVPCALPIALPVATTAPGLFAIRLIEALESFEHDAVVALLLDVHYQRATGVDAAAAREIPAAIRETGFVNGHRAWRRIADATRNAALNTLLARLREWHAQLEDAASTADRIDTIAGPIMQSAARSERDTAAWQALLESLTHWHDAIAADSHTDLSVFFKELRAILDETRVPPDVSGPGVHCLDLESARHLAFDHVFFIGANEGAIPAHVPRNAVYSAADLARLRGAGIELGDADIHRERERLLFNHIFESARGSLTLMWHTLTQNGKAALQSPFVADAIELFPGICIETPASPSDALLPAPDRVACERELENIAQHIAEPQRYLSNWDAIAAGRHAEDRRAAFAPFDIYDGVLINTDLRDEITARYGADYVFSATELETYIDCPFRFLLQRLLKIDQIDDEPVELDPKTRGNRMHDALQRFHTRFLGKSWPEIAEAEAVQAMNESVDATFDERERRYSPALWRAERERMRAALLRYAVIERERDAGWKPAFTEFSFGRDDEREPCVIETDLGPVRYKGIVDRIDAIDVQLRIIDYKSSIVAAKQINEGKTIQLILYAWAIEQLMPDRECNSAEYIVPGKRDRCDALTRNKAEQCAERQAAVKTRVVESLRGIRAGQFHLTLDDERCAYCPANKVCRYERARIERKSAPAS